MEQQLQIAASIMRGLRNMLQPISQLPPELMAMIFHNSQQHLPSFLPMLDITNNSMYDNHHKHWLMLLHVCRHWRGIIATFPSLWSTLDSGLMPESFLKRSSAAPLTIYLGVRKAGVSEKLLKTLLPHTSRFKELHIAADDWDGSSPVYQLLRSPAPRLSSLSIVAAGNDATSAALPPVFAGEMPNLRQLTLEYFTSWPKDMFRDLTHLLLYDQCEFSRPTTSEFLDVLELCPRLEELALVHAGPTRPEGSDSMHRMGRHVALDYLQELNLGDWPTAPIICRFLSHLILPPKTDMYFWGILLLNREDDLGALIPEDSSRLFNLQSIKNWYFARQPRVILDVPFVAVLGSNQTLYMYGTFHATQITPMLSRYPLHGIETLGVRDSCMRSGKLPRPIWKDILERLPLLKSLRILAFNSPTTTRSVLSALLPQEVGEAKTVKLLCPALESLGIEHDSTLPSFFVGRVAEERAKHSSPISSFKILVYSPRPFNRPPGSVISSESDSDRDEEFRSKTEDDLRLLKTHVGKVEFEYMKPLSLDIVPTSWPTRAYEWTRRLHGGI